MKKVKIACIGAGYFAKFHVEAWTRIPEVELVAICDQKVEKAAELAELFHIPNVYPDLESLLRDQEFSVLDVITPPDSHLPICAQASAMGKHILCQKPLAPSLAAAREIVALTEAAGVRFMVHENFRFQPWYRKIKQLIERGYAGAILHTMTIKMRMGDGWGPRAYLDRQPYFQTMPRLFIYETGIHYIDVMRYLAGEIKSVYARLRKLNPVIAGEDCALVIFEFAGSGLGIIDGNRYNEPSYPDPRYTFGETTIEGNAGTIRLYADGKITTQSLGKREIEQPYDHDNKNFGSDCVYATQRHFIHAFLSRQKFETNGRDYLRNLFVQEAIYASSDQGENIYINEPDDE